MTGVFMKHGHLDTGSDVHTIADEDRDWGDESTSQGFPEMSTNY